MRTRHVAVFVLCVSNAIVALCNVSEDEKAGSFDISPATPPNVAGGENVVLWWTPFTGIQGQSRPCSLGSCYFTENRDYLNNGQTKAVLFYGSDFNVEDLPLPRPRGQWWALLHEESPKNQPLFDHELVLQLFNLTSTFRRASHFPLTLQHLSSLETLTSKEEYVPLAEKSLFGEREELSPVIYVQSDCDTPSERDLYVQELSKYIKVDSYGTCLNNRDLPSQLRDAAANYDHPEFRKIVAKYKFAIAIENAGCEDYITEKLWRPLSVGTVPIYWGSPSISDWAPNSKSIINIKDFDSPRQLAVFLHRMLGDDALYESYLKHKNEGLITNANLIEAMKTRKWGINNDFEKGNFIEHFECYVCDQIFAYGEEKVGPNKERRLQANSDHYGCPEPPSVLTGKANPKSFWVEEWHRARVEAQVLNELVSEAPGLFTSDQFFSEVINRLQKDGFFHKFHQLHEDL